MRKNRSIKPKIRWKAKKSPGVWQDQHQTLEVQQELISLTKEIIGYDFSIKYFKSHGKSTVFRGFFIWRYHNGFFA